MSNDTIGPPTEFQELVRDALQHLFEVAYLQTHPLAALCGDGQLGERASGKRLRQDLFDAIEALHPGAGVAPTARAWRAFTILDQRYIAGQEVADVWRQLALSRRQYYREHEQAIQAVASVLWERWQLSTRWASTMAMPSGGGGESDHLARVEAGQLIGEQRRCRIDLDEVLRGVRALLQPLCERSGVRLTIQAPSPWPTVAGERIALRQALLAVLSHTIRNTGAETVEVTVTVESPRVEIAIRLPGGTAAVPVELGVDAARPFVEALQGTLTYLPSAGCQTGDTLILSLPADERPTLLVVDNNADFIRLVERFLGGEGWHVVGASDVDEAYAFAQRLRPRAILLDAVMPGRDGWELLLDLKRTASTRMIPVIICSVLDEPQVALSLGAAAYLHKPVEQAQLARLLKRFW